MEYSDELWKPEYRCKQCGAPYDLYALVAKEGKIIGRQWRCENHDDFYFEPDQLPSEQLAAIIRQH